MGIINLPTWVRLQRTPYDPMKHEGDSASYGVVQCPVCGKGRIVSQSRTWDDWKHRYVEVRDESGCDCPPVHERKEL